MNRYYYDLHIHSCLSPCGDDDNTPNNIAGMASISGINIVALTDHNTTRNCPAFFSAAKRYGIIPIAGMELTTAEDIHVVCLFEHLSDAERFNDYVQGKRTLIKNRPHIFGEQTVLDDEDNIIDREENLLINATKIPVEDACRIISEYNGICFPAHIDRNANGIISILGDLPSDSDFTLFELHDGERIEEFSARYKIPKDRFIISSDAHYLTDMREKEFYFELDDEPYSTARVRSELFKLLRSKR